MIMQVSNHHPLHSQVCNLTNCIKVAVDFLHWSSLETCGKLQKEFRDVNRAEAWKDDILQLRNLMWYSWKSCTELETRWA